MISSIIDLFEIMGDLSNLGTALQALIIGAIIAFILVLLLWFVVYNGVKFIVNLIRKRKKKTIKKMM